MCFPLLLNAQPRQQKWRVESMGMRGRGKKIKREKEINTTRRSQRKSENA
jgi:hypothetical protein